MTISKLETGRRGHKRSGFLPEPEPFPSERGSVVAPPRRRAVEGEWRRRARGDAAPN